MMEHKFIKGKQPLLIKAGDRRLLLGMLKMPPELDCRVVAEDYYQNMLKEIAHWKGCVELLKDILEIELKI